MSNKVKLSEVLKVKRGKVLHGKDYSYHGYVIRLTLANFFESGGFKQSNLNRNVFYKGNIEKSEILRKGTLITPLTEQSLGLLGSIAKIPENNRYIACGDIGIIKIIDENKYSKSYVYHLFRYDYIRNQLTREAQKSKVRHITANDFYNIELAFPQKSIQNKIGKLFDDIDAKIELNNKMNNNLMI